MGQNHHRAGNALDGARSWPRWRTFPTARQTQAATISSGSFRTDGMIVIPCSMKTLAGIRAGYAEGLAGRAADVVLKEGASWCWSRGKCRSARSIWRTCWRCPAWAWRWSRRCQLTTTTRRRLTISPIISSPGVLDQFGLDYHKARRWNGLRTAEQFAQEIE